MIGKQIIIVAALIGAASAAPDEFARVKAAVANGLKDPQSAQFRNIMKSKKAPAQYVCGEVNAKNSYGGRTGFKSFLYVAKTNAAFILEISADTPDEIFEASKLFLANCHSTILR